MLNLSIARQGAFSLRGWDSVNASSAKPQTAVAFAPLVWGYGRLCLSEALTLNQRIIFNRTGRTIFLKNYTYTVNAIRLLLNAEIFQSVV